MPHSRRRGSRLAGEPSLGHRSALAAWLNGSRAVIRRRGRLGHPGHDRGELLFAPLHQPLDEVPAASVRVSDDVPPVDRTCTPVHEARPNEPVAGPAGVGRVDAQAVGHGREVERLAGPEQDQHPHLRHRHAPVDALQRPDGCGDGAAGEHQLADVTGARGGRVRRHGSTVGRRRPGGPVRCALWR